MTLQDVDTETFYAPQDWRRRSVVWLDIIDHDSQTRGPVDCVEK